MSNGTSVNLAVLRNDIDTMLAQIRDNARAQDCLDFIHENSENVEAQHAFVYGQYRGSKGEIASGESLPPAPTTPVDLQIATVPIHWYVDAPPHREYLLREVGTGAGVLPRGKVGLFVAQGGGGKTMALCQLAIAIATATPWLGAWKSDLGRVLIVLGEEDQPEVQRRLYHAAKLAGVVPPDGSIEFAALSGVDCTVLGKNEEGNPTETPYLVVLRERIARERYDAVFLDPLARFAGGEAETQNAWATRLISAFESISKESGATVIVAHHTPQWHRVSGGDSKAARPDATMARGVTGLTDGARWMAAMTMEHPKDDDGNETGEEFITIALAKNNYGRCDLRPIMCERSSAHEGALVPLGDERQAQLQITKRKPVPKREQRRADRQQRNAEEKAEQERSAAEAAHREAERRTREDDAARAILAELGPALSYRQWEAEMRGRLIHCSDKRAAAARVRVTR